MSNPPDDHAIEMQFLGEQLEPQVVTDLRRSLRGLSAAEERVHRLACRIDEEIRRSTPPAGMPAVVAPTFP